ncbi:hypothetical protein CFP56_001712, partial [Quercus suber]
MMKKPTLAAFSSKASIRSISLPARSHPTTLRVEEELNKIKSWEASSSSKPLGNEIEAFPMSNLDHHLSAVVRVLNETSLITSSIFHSFLLFLSVPMLKPKPSRWSLVSKLVQKGVHELASKDQHENVNELEGVDLALNSLLLHNSSKDIEAQKIKSAQIKLDALDVSMKGLEKGLECLFRHLIQTR